ncbi:vegetative cell wall protein gp1-like [Pipistrellus kuhlii]|uniref:vegetative cell wall protein gp1-like n=1 Tax=Pipistrellus kuhlii TaxID=59472 RepID=UPI00174F6770|nr:vegetative cell wall protein gp1-like [Pipistrellus kuhlii]
MAGCGLSEDTFFSSFFPNYGSSWETPSSQHQLSSLQGLSRPSGAQSATDTYPAPTSQPSGNPRKEAGAGTLPPEQLRAKPRNSSATFPKSPRAPRPCAPGARQPSRPPVAPRGCGAASPPRWALSPPPLPPGPEPPLPLKWLQSQVEASPDPAGGGKGAEGMLRCPEPLASLGAHRHPTTTHT